VKKKKKKKKKRRRKEKIENRERREERDWCFIIKIMHWVSTVFSNALGNTIATQWRRLNIRFLLWGCFCDFFLFFP
jgi:hypothetical protein